MVLTTSFFFKPSSIVVLVSLRKVAIRARKESLPHRASNRLWFLTIPGYFSKQLTTFTSNLPPHTNIWTYCNIPILNTDYLRVYSQARVYSDYWARRHDIGIITFTIYVRYLYSYQQQRAASIKFNPPAVNLEYSRTYCRLFSDQYLSAKFLSLSV